MDALELAMAAADRWERGSGGPDWSQVHVMVATMYATIALAKEMREIREAYIAVHFDTPHVSLDFDTAHESFD